MTKRCPIAVKIGASIRKRRLAKGETQVSLSHKVGVKRCAMNRWESGRGIFPTPTLVLIAKVLGVDAWLFLVGLDDLVELPKVKPLPPLRRRKSKIFPIEEVPPEGEPSLAAQYWALRRNQGTLDPKEENDA